MNKYSKFDRRKFLYLAGSIPFVTSFSNIFSSEFFSIPVHAEIGKQIMRGEEALKKLMEGNERYLNAKKTGHYRRTAERRAEVAESQNPFAVILACSDSRVAPEIIFDQGIGDLFVIRVAGNIVDNDTYGVLGSIEYAVKVLDSPLIMVLGHHNCGAVKGAIDAIENGTVLPGNINNIVESIKPAVITVKEKQGNLLENAIEANVELGVNRLNKSKPIISEFVNQNRIKIVGGNYDLLSGKVSLIG